MAAGANGVSAQQPPPSPPTSSDAYAKPQPRHPRSPAHSATIRVQNRRREWLERHPEYLNSLEHELADPILYDTLIRRFQTPAEREKEGRTKGYSRVLEVDLLRGEARLSQLAKGEASQTAGAGSGIEAVSVSAPASTDQDVFIREYAEIAAKEGECDDASPRGGPGKEDEQQTMRKKQESRERWDEFLRRRFVLGRDEDFDYRSVDENDDYDALERREEEDHWFNDEDPAWASEGGGGAEEASSGPQERMLEGETGIQDY